MTICAVLKSSRNLVKPLEKNDSKDACSNSTTVKKIEFWSIAFFAIIMIGVSFLALVYCLSGEVGRLRALSQSHSNHTSHSYTQIYINEPAQGAVFVVPATLLAVSVLGLMIMCCKAKCQKNLREADTIELDHLI